MVIPPLARIYLIFPSRLPPSEPSRQGGRNGALVQSGCQRLGRRTREARVAFPQVILTGQIQKTKRVPVIKTLLDLQADVKSQLAAAPLER